MSERPEPNLDQVREAMREHDERSQEIAPEPEPDTDPAEPDEPDDES